MLNSHCAWGHPKKNPLFLNRLENTHPPMFRVPRIWSGGKSKILPSLDAQNAIKTTLNSASGSALFMNKK